MPRQSPSDSATLYPVGTVKKGNDQQKWRVTKITTKTGKTYQRWKRCETKSITRQTHNTHNTYLQHVFTHDNGGRPFKVCYGQSVVYVYKQGDYDDEDGNYDVLVKKFTKVRHIFIPPEESEDKTFQTLGNSVLLKMSAHKYVFIGDRIIEFTTPDKDVITHFYSPIGNSDVPYVVAVGKKFVYLINDEEYITNKEEYFGDYFFWSEAYDVTIPKKDRHKFLRVKTIQKRLW